MFKVIATITTKILIVLGSIFSFALPVHVQNPTTRPEEITEVSTTTEKTEQEISTSTEQITKTEEKPIVEKPKTITTEKKVETIQNQIPKIIEPIKPQVQIPVDYETLNTTVRKSLVNILCNTQSGGPLSPITGSGVIISATGVILTNAHIGQYFLLKDFNGQKDFLECVIRTGSPAYPVYKAELVYLSPTWVEKNKTLLIEQNPQGTGEYDYAFLRITERIDKSNIGLTPFLPISLDENNLVGNISLLVSYPAGFLGGQSILQDLYQSSSITSISKIFTFGSTTIDLISVPGTVVSQKGSSGGAVVNSRGELVGIISTSSNGDQTSSRDLRAITLSYINRNLKEESGSDLINLLSSPVEYAKNFNQNIAPKLTEILTNAILKK